MLVLLFCILFPYSLFSQNTIKAPRNSLSYFLENDETAASESDETPVVVPAAPETTATQPEIQTAEPVEETVIVETEEKPTLKGKFARVEEIRARLKAAEAEKQALAASQKEAPVEAPVQTPEPAVADEKTVTAVPAVADAEKTASPVIADTKEAAAEPVAVDSGKTASPVVADTREAAVEPAVVDAPATTEVAQTETTEPETIKNAGTDSPFSSAMAKMQQNKSKRIADAEKLGVVLPSQGGDIATVSPTLSRMQMAIKAIMTR